MSKVVKKIATAIAVVAAVVFTGGTALLATIGKALVTAAVSMGISRLVAKRANTAADAGGDGGARIQLPPATVNKLPIIYGTAFVGGSITDAMLSTDQKTMWYVIALAEHSDDQGGGGGSYTFDTNKCYYDGKEIQFGSNGAVTGLITNTSTPQVDTRCNGFLYVYLFNNGSSSGINTGGQTAYDILSTTNGVPASKAWTVGQQTMTNCAFAIVKVIYNTDAGTTGVGQLMVNITNSLTKPGDCILDYMLNERYGCGLPIDSIDTSSLTALDVYSDELIDYKPVGWNTGDPYSQQARYRINGPLDTGQNCLNNLQFLVDSADSWLQYSELTGKWKVVINKLYTGYPTVTGLFLVDSSNLIGGIEVSPIDLNETYNQIEVAYPNTNIKDQTDYYIIDLFEDDPQLLSPNEAINRLNVTLPLVNNAVQARYLAARRIYQSREDLVIAFRLDYSGIQVEAGDVIRVTHEVYGWTDKLFRVNNVAETKDDTGNLYADIQAFEYSDGIYNDIVEDYIPAFNTGLIDPNVISQPGTPTIVAFTDANALITGFEVTSTTPANGIVLYMDFNYGNSNVVTDHRLYRTVQQSNSAPYAANTSVTIPVNDLAAGNYYWSTTARNNTSGKRSNSSNVLNWAGAGIQPYNPNSNTGGLPGNVYAPNSIPANAIIGGGGNYITGITVKDEGNTVVASANTLNFTGSGVEVSNASGIANVYVPGYYKSLGSASFQVPNEANNTVLLPVDVTSTSTRNIPVYITGTDPGANYYYPFFQGTSTTANYYLANSTGQMQGAFSSSLEIQDGDDNWYNILHANFSQTLSSGSTLIHNYVLQLVSDTDNTIVQVVPGITKATLGIDRVFTPFIHTINLNANLPYFLEATRVPQTWSPFSIDGGGLWIRNMTAGSTIYLILGQYAGRGPL